MGENDQVTALSTELRDLRRRGLANIEGAGQLEPLDLPQLEALARRHSSDGSGPRTELIRQLLHDSLDAYREAGHQPDAKLLGQLFFEDGTGETVTHKSAGDLLDTALKDNNLAEATFNKRRPGMFRDFAGFLLTFVQEERLPSWRRPPVLIGAAIVLALVVTAVIVATRPHGRTNPTANRPSTSSSKASVTATAPSNSTNSTTAPLPTLTFDDLGGGSSIINVYPGIQNTAQDKRSNGTYQSGSKVSVVCRATGRTITSDPSVGESPRSSSTWVRIIGTPGAQQYASLVYADIDPASLRLLPSCQNTP
ncbi:MAG: hypothetical protein ACJ74U_10905 [Jatrophihabitantaceae bacterium]